jgi:hypothetical protein
MISCNNEKTSSSAPKKANNEVIKTQQITNKIGPNLLGFDRLVGKVKSMKQSTFHASSKNKNIQKVMLGNAYNTTDEKLYYNSAMKLQTRTTYEINPNNKCSKSSLFGPSKSLQKTTKYVYDIHDNLTEEISYNLKQEVISKQKYRYDIQGRLIEEMKFIGQNKFDIRTTYSYNPSNQIIETKYFRPEKTLIIVCKTSYHEFDQEGNWLKSIEQTNKGSIFIVERKIEYY